MDYTTLKEAAEKATPGPWEVRELSIRGYGLLAYKDGIHDRSTQMPIQDATYIALANPTTILALLRRLEASERIVYQLGHASPVLPQDQELYYELIGMRKL